MKRLAIIASISAVILTTAVAGLAEQAKGNNADKKAIRKLADEYVAAFNKGDAKALASLWTPLGDYVGPRGDTVKGREELEKRFARFFAANEQVKLAIRVKSIRFVGTDVAIVDGVPELTPPLQGPPVEARATKVLVKRDGRWMIESARDILVYPPSNYHDLKELEWLIGEWADAEAESKDVSVQTTCNWTANKNFIIRSYTAKVQDRISREGTQLIGWDPQKDTIRSWAFDSSGGFSQGVWRRDGNRWIIETSGILQDGDEISATNIITRTDEDRLTFQSTNRTINGQSDPDIGPIEIRRVSAETAEQGGADSHKKPMRETVLPQ